MKTRKKVNGAKHSANVRRVSRRLAKEDVDRARTGAPHPGDRCGATVAHHRCTKAPGHSKKHRDISTGHEWKDAT
jgi:hypothetical protein